MAHSSVNFSGSPFLIRMHPIVGRDLALSGELDLLMRRSGHGPALVGAARLEGG